MNGIGVYKDSIIYMDKLTCISLTNNIEVSQDGTVRPCCLYKGSFGNIQDYSIIAKNQKNVIDNFSRNHVECNRCWEHESLNIESKRLQLNKIWTNFNTIPNVLEIQLNNLCNLACTTCSPVHSSIWAAKLKTIPINNSYDKKNQADRINRYINLIVERNIDIINLLGGEPSINPEVYMLLDRLIELKLNTKITIWIITNGYDIQSFFDRYINHFYFNVSISIDGITTVFEYMRYGHSWNSLVSNLTYLGKLQTQHKFGINFTYTYSVCNIFHYTDFKDWYDTEIEKLLESDLHLNRVDGPAVLVPRLFDDSLREKLHSDIEPMVVTVTNNELNNLHQTLNVLDTPRGISYSSFNLHSLDLYNIYELSKRNL